jgi:hypothetical protein
MHTRLVTAPVTALAALALAASGLQAPAVAKAKAPPRQDVTFTAWDFGDGDPGGDFSGTSVAGGALTTTAPTTTRSYDDPHDSPDTGTTTYEEATWVSPTVRTPFGLTELVASWNAHTPDGSWVEVSVQGSPAGGAPGTTSKWYVLGRWSESDDQGFHPTSLGGQGDDTATVAIDTLVTREGVTLEDYRVKVSLLRRPGTTGPSVDFVGAMASHVVTAKKHVTSATTMTHDVELAVPTYSQETHLGHFPQWDNGGEAWCSPTSTTMVLRYFRPSSPSPEEYAWVSEQLPDEPAPWVDHAARHTYDYNYDGAGNWPFNTAYAARYDLEGFVTRLRSLAEAEQLVRAHIPVVVSMSFKESELDGAGYGTNGHLLTIVGFEADGDPIVNDPASHLEASDDAVRVVYDRAQFEAAWIGSTGGVSYVIHPEDVALPLPGTQANW